MVIGLNANMRWNKIAMRYFPAGKTRTQSMERRPKDDAGIELRWKLESRLLKLKCSDANVG